MVWKSSHLVQYLTIEYIIIIIKIKNKTSYVLRCYIEKLIKLCVQMKCNFLVPAPIEIGSIRSKPWNDKTSQQFDFDP